MKSEPAKHPSAARTTEEFDELLARWGAAIGLVSILSAVVWLSS